MPVEGLSSYRPNMHELRRLCSYWLYRLPQASDGDLFHRISQVRKTTQHIKLHLRNPFSGKDPIMVFDFVALFVGFCEKLQLTEDEAHIILPQFLEEPALTHYHAAEQATTSSLQGVIDWPTATDWLLRMFATNENIREAVDSFAAIR